MSGPEFIDNRDGNTLALALARVLAGRGDGMCDEGRLPETLDIASAFFHPAGFAQIAGALDGLSRIRLMIAAEPPHDAKPPVKRIEETQAQFERRVLNEGLQELDEGLRRERNRIPFTRAGRAAVRQVIAVLRSGQMETRRYEHAFMHAKAYIFATRPGEFGSAGVIAGSSNLTRAGLVKNLELNLGHYDDPVVRQAQGWFNELWEDATPFDLAEILEEAFAPFTPFDIFLRTLFQLYGEEVEALEREEAGLPLTNFQKHGAARALRLIREIGGVIVADEVGLGKTFIAGEIIDLYVKRRQRALLICPAQLRDSTWRKFLARFQLPVECVSYEELAGDRQLRDAQRPHADQEKLLRPLDEYQLIVVDEAHNYRNPDAPTRAAALRRLLFGARRDVLLLTATPVNNSLWDLYHLMRFFLRQDAFLADRGILSIRERFEEAMHEDPESLSPDLLYPIIDATTVKRTRQFVKKHYGGDMIRLPDGREAAIVFPKTIAMTVRYSVRGPLNGLFDLIEEALDPEGQGRVLTFARYTPEQYLKDEGDEEEEARAAATAGLLRSGLLKRCESSAFAFRRTVEKLIGEHEAFLEALGKGHVLTTRFLKELAASDETSLDELLSASDETMPSSLFEVAKLRRAVTADLAMLRELCDAVRQVTPANDPKVKAIVRALEGIAAEAVEEATTGEDEAQRRKVILFSFFADTVRYLREALGDEVARNPKLAAYHGRIVAVSGGDGIEEDVSRQRAVSGFAPISSEAPPGSDADLYDLMVSTDVLAEGVNLQQCRHIINADMPWNPMRLVQRHGRIDRIGSPHARVFLRTVFPADRLDALLNLEARIMRKLAMAASSVGVVAPVDGAHGGHQVFTETREEIEKLLSEDATLFERGGTAAAAQSGEEYRLTLRKALAQGRDRIRNMPWGAGSILAKGERRGAFFCAAVGDRTYLRFVPTEPNWLALDDRSLIVREVGTCLRLIECEEQAPRADSPILEERIFDLWDVARNDIWQAWMLETDPANLQPKVRPLNLRVAEFIRGNRPVDDEGARVNDALDVLETPWPRREEEMLRGWFADESCEGAAKARFLVEQVMQTGLEPFNQPAVLPPIARDDIQLICWMGLIPATATA